jgi:phospho-N-acetylmuramoyl-pentapeptide-transferase
MLYYLFHYLESLYRIPGGHLFQFISFRTALAFLGSIIISLVFGKRIIQYLQKQQVGEIIRDLGLQGQIEKQGTPTMGGLIILAAIIIPTVLFAKIDNVYIWLMLVCTVWLGMIGFIDDYIKVFKKDKKGLAGRFKLLGQVGLGLIFGLTLFFHKDVVISERMSEKNATAYVARNPDATLIQKERKDKTIDYVVEHRSTKTTIPFVKNHELDYARFISFIGPYYRDYAWLLYIPIVIFIITAVSNGVNMTDGLDGLAAGVSAVVLVILAIFAYVSGNTIFANYLNIMYIPNLGELVIFLGACIGACVGFLWYNSYPAQVFMGDTGSLALGGLIAAVSLMVRKELLIPVFCGIFLIENLSVIMQVSYFKYTKKKYGEGKRIFKMAPLHHHYQKKNYHEAKIVARFWILAVFLGILSIITLKLR